MRGEPKALCGNRDRSATPSDFFKTGVGVPTAPILAAHSLPDAVKRTWDGRGTGEEQNCQALGLLKAFPMRLRSPRRDGLHRKSAAGAASKARRHAADGGAGLPLPASVEPSRQPARQAIWGLSMESDFTSACRP